MALGLLFGLGSYGCYCGYYADLFQEKEVVLRSSSFPLFFAGWISKHFMDAVQRRDFLR